MSIYHRAELTLYRWMYETTEGTKAAEDKGKTMAWDSDSRPNSIEQKTKSKSDFKVAVEQSQKLKVVS